jgi:hypothetical protein
MKISSILFPAVFAFLLSSAVDANNGAVRGADRHLQAQNDIVPDEYIVVFKGSPSGKSGTAGTTKIGNISSSNKSEVAVAVKAQGGNMKNEYSFVLNGFTARLTPLLLAALKKNPHIDYIEKNAVAATSATQTLDLPSGLDRIDQTKGRDGSYTYVETGAGVNVYVIDTGIDSTHSEFTGRLGNGYNAVQTTPQSPQAWDDCQGHGTHVASTIGGSKYGVAKGVTLHGVRVLGCAGSGTYGDIIAGMDWVTQQHVGNPGQKSVANMSLGGGFSSSVNAAVERMVAAGIVVAVAAGNDNLTSAASLLRPPPVLLLLQPRTGMTPVLPFLTLKPVLISLLLVLAFSELGTTATLARERSVELRWRLHMWLVLLPCFFRMEAAAQTRSSQPYWPRRSPTL